MVNINNKKVFILTQTGILISSSFAFPINVVQAKEYSDIWYFDKHNVESDAIGINAIISEDKTEEDYYNSNSTVRQIINFKDEFEFTEKNSLGYPIENILLVTSNTTPKPYGISYLSFINVKHLRNIGAGYLNTNGKFNEGTSFTSAQIKKIFWNKDDFYLNEIYIRKEAFYVNQIEYLDLPNKVVYIGDSAFRNNKISWIKGWENVKEIGKYGFHGNELVSFLPNGYKFEIPSSVEIIKESAFEGNNLTYVKIHKNIKKVENRAFAGNPLQEIYIENPETQIVKDLNYEDYLYDLTVYGHGDANNFTEINDRSKFKSNYINIDPYEESVKKAEETGDKEKISEAFLKVSELPHGYIREEFIKRIYELNNTASVENYVINAEKSMLMSDYNNAKSKVDLLENENAKSTLLTRLSILKEKITEKRIAEIKKQLEEDSNNLTLGEINNLKEELEEMTNEENNDLILLLESKRKKAELKSYSIALSYINYAKENKTIKNVTNAQKVINSFPDDYKLTEDITIINENEFLLDSEGNKVIDEENSYQKETVKKTDEETGVEITKEIFKINSNGDKILKEGLTSPIYIKDPNFGKKIIIKKEKGSKEELQNKLEEFSDEVYAATAIEIAKKYFSQEKIDEALVLSMNVEKEEKRKEFLKEVEDIQGELDKFSKTEENLKELLLEYELLKDDKYKKEIVEILNNFSNEEIKRIYNLKIKKISYIHKIKELLDEARKNGFTEETLNLTLVNLSLLGEDHEKYNNLYNDFLSLKKNYDDYEKEYIDIYSKFSSLYKDDLEILNNESYYDFTQKVNKVKVNSPYYEKIKNLEEKIREKLINLQSDKKNMDLLEEEIRYLSINKKYITNEKINNLMSDINKIESKKYRDELKRKYDLLIKEYIDEYFLSKNNISSDDLMKVELYLNQLTDLDMKKNIQKEIDDKTKKLIDEILNEEGGLIKEKDLLNALLEAMKSQEDKKNILSIVDDKIIDQIKKIEEKSKEEKDNNKTIEKNNFEDLNNLYSMISDLSKKEGINNVVNNITEQYVTTSYPEIYEGDTISNTNYHELIDAYNYFDGIHMDTKNDYFNDIKQQITQKMEENLIKNLNNDIKIDNSNNNTNQNNLNEEYITNDHSQNDNSKNTQNNNSSLSNIKNDYFKTLAENIENITDESVKNNLSSHVENYLKRELNNLDLSNNNNLSNLTKLGDMIDSATSVGGSMVSSVQSLFTDYVQDNSNKIWDIAVQENNQDNIMKFLSEYISQDDIRNLTHNDHDNVIGTQNNEEKKYVKDINNSGEDINELKEALKNLQKIIDGLTRAGNSMNDSSINTIGSSNIQQMTPNNNQIQMLKNTGFPTETRNDEINFLDLQNAIREMEEKNNDEIEEKIISLKAATVSKDKDIKKQLESYKNGNKNLNNILIGLGASMWLLILLGIMYNSNLNLRNGKKIDNFIEEGNERMEEMLKNNKEILEEIKKIKKTPNQ